MELTLSFQAYFLRKNRNFVTIEDFVEHLSAFQDIIYLIAKEQQPSINIKDFRFLVKKIERGSFECIVEPYYISKDLKGRSPVDRIINEFEEISTLIDTEGDKKTYEQLSEKVRTSSARRTLYNDFEKIIPKENNAFQIYIGDPKSPEAVRIFASKERYKKRIDTWRKMDKKPKTETFIGVIKNLNAYYESRKHIKFVGPNGEKIKYYYKDDEKEKIIKLYDSEIIKIKGIYNEYTKTIEKLIDFKRINSLELEKLKNIDFLHPITFKLTYEFGVIYCSNEEFDLYALGSNYNELMGDLYNRIDDTLDMFLNPNISFTDSSEEYRKKFLSIFMKKGK